MRILVPLDGSARSEQAVGIAAKLAFALPAAQLVLLRVVELSPMSTIPVDAANVFDVASTACEDYLRAIAHRDLFQGLTIERHVAIGVPVATICDMARSLDADLIVMTSHGRTGLARFALGSIAEAVVRESTIPTLIVRAVDAVLAPARILVPLDGTPFAEAVLGPASQLARGWHAELRLLRVVHNPTANAANDRDQIAAARRYLESLQRQLEQAGVTTSISVMMGVPQERIIEAIAHTQHPCDVIALATHERTPLEKLESGGVTEYVFHHLRCPMLIMHPQSVEVPVTT